MTTLQLLAGRNVAAIQNEVGGWEVVQFETATLIGDATYELSNLIRGQAGTEREMRAALAPGATFVVLGTEIARVSIGPNEIGLPFYWRYGPANRDIGDRTYAADTHTFRGVGLKPLSPMHVRAERAGGGDMAVRWVRRTRIGGDSWDSADMPLAEETERYEVDILNGSTVVRTLASATPTCSYTAANQVTDFGATQSALSVAVYQLSAATGRGTPRTAVV